MVSFSTCSAFTPCSWIRIASESSGAWIGEPTDQRLMLVRRISYSSPRPAHQPLRVRRTPVGDEEVAFARKHVVHAAEALRHHGRRGDAVARRHAAEVERLLDVLLVAHPARDPDACCAA
jgi:hypothetical protein